MRGFCKYMGLHQIASRTGYSDSFVKMQMDLTTLSVVITR